MSDLHWLAAFVLSVGATARITRLVTWDHLPFAVWWRARWDWWTRNREHPQHDGPWTLLMHCGYCFGVWAAALVVGSASLSVWLTGSIIWVWWLLAGWLTVSYLGAILMAFDGDDAEED